MTAWVDILNIHEKNIVVYGLAIILTKGRQMVHYFGDLFSL